MNKIIRKERLNPSVTLMEVSAPLVAKKAEPGQFIILRVDEKGERIPLTVADYDREKGTITIIFQIVGATTEKLNHLEEGDFIHDFVGPLGRATHTEGLKKVAVVGGGVGCAIAYPVAKKLYEQGTEVHAIVGFRSQDLVILEDEFAAHSTRLVRMSDDGSWGEKGLVTDALKKLIESGEQYDEVITIGPLIMMKFVCLLTKQYGLMKPWPGGLHTVISSAGPARKPAICSGRRNKYAEYVQGKASHALTGTGGAQSELPGSCTGLQRGDGSGGGQTLPRLQESFLCYRMPCPYPYPGVYPRSGCRPL